MFLRRVSLCLLATAFLLQSSERISVAQDDPPAKKAETAEAAPDETPTHVEIDPLIVALGPEGKIETMAMDRENRLLLAVSWDVTAGLSEKDEVLDEIERLLDQKEGKLKEETTADIRRAYALKFVDASGKVTEEWQLKDQIPHMVHATPDGDIYIAGDGRMTCYDSKGNPKHVLHFADLYDGHLAEYHASGITANDKYVFLAFGNGRSLRATEEVHRFNRDLTEPTKVVDEQFGCCAHLDLDVRNGELLIPENSRHRVNRFSLEGELIDRWGERNRESIQGFAACCNPVNVDFGADGVLYTAESGIGRVKKYSQTGEYLGLVGYVDTTKFDRGSRLASMSCYIPIEVGPNADRIYIMDVRANFVRILERKTQP